MKRLSILLALLSAWLQYSIAQTPDTLFMGGPREPTLYYWDNNWVDQYIGQPTNVSNWCVDQQRLGARHCDTKDSLRVIGIAGLASTRWPDIFIQDSTMEGRVPEYFQLLSHNSDSTMHLLAQARWDTCTPRYVMELIDYSYYAGAKKYYPNLYEAYFDHPVTVVDSFYVAFTEWNNKLEVGPHYGEVYGYTHILTEYFTVQSITGSFRHVPPLVAHRFGFEEVNWYTNCPDTMWHFDTAYFWPCVFPIFDTSRNASAPNDSVQPYNPGHGYSIYCDTVRGLYRMATNTDEITLNWNAGGQSRWSVVCVPANVSVDSGAVMQTDIPYFTFDNLAPGTYAACVRTECSDTSYSAWSHPLFFSVDSTNHNASIDIPDDYTFVYPNPATTQATIISSFRILNIELFSADGHRVGRHQVDANAYVLDLHSYAKGVYIIRINTNYGEIKKKLVVQ